MYVLGISGATGHDPSACLMCDGQLLTMCEEERFLTVPHACDELPIQSIQYCLAANHITLDDVDVIAYSWDKSLVSEGRKTSSKYEEIESLFSKDHFDYNGPLPKIEIINHHLAHAASSFYFSGYERAAVLVVDGWGEKESTSWYLGEQQTLTLLGSIPDHESLGVFYSAMTKALGFDFLNDGKTMGLAPYGEIKYKFPRIITDANIGYRILGSEKHKYWDQQGFWYKVLAEQRVNGNIFIGKKLSDDRKDSIYSWNFHLAASVQHVLEECYVNLAKMVANQTNANTLCLAGGVALNCVANGKLEQSNIFEDLFIQPAAGDAGTAIGAAAQVLVKHGYKIKPLEHVYYGTSYSNDDVRRFIQAHQLNYETSDRIDEKIAAYLEQGKIVAIFRDRAEFGPRALGNRSILANPSIVDMKDKVNKNIKFRESFRPFGASILKEYASDWFENIVDSPYMVKTYRAKSDMKDKIPGVVHVDGTSRLQTVTAQSNAFFHSVLYAFNKKTNIPILLNTSFNLKGKAMVNSLEDALDTFMKSKLDILVLQDYIITK